MKRNGLVNNKIVGQIERKIDEIEIEYRKVQGLILTEDDLKCILYQKLSSIPELNAYGYTGDRGKQLRANMIHTEVSWYNDEGKLSIKPDMTILDPRNLMIALSSEKGTRLPSKSFEFDGDAIIFELKFIRQKSGITPSVFKNEIKKDWKKIQGLFRRVAGETPEEKIFCFFVIFSKARQEKICREFERFLDSEGRGRHHRIIYKSGDVF